MKTVEDRPGHDRRYALSSAKLMSETGWAHRWNSTPACPDRKLV